MFNLYTYSLPFREPFKTAAGTFNERNGVILRFHTSDTDLVSEAAPLPGFSSETLDDVILGLNRSSTSINAFLQDDFSVKDLELFLNTLPDLPSLQFGISSLGLSVLTERSGKSLSVLFDKKLPEKIQLNAVIGTSGPDAFRARAASFIDSGFTVLKCKVSAEPGHLPQTLQEISGAFPEVRFRLDANQSWPAGRVRELSELFRNIPIQYIEEPAVCSSIPDFMEIAGQSVIPVAADESLSRFGLKNWVHSQAELPFLIIKPTLLGNLMELFATIGRRDHLEDRVIFTSTLESAVGRKMIATFAGLLGSKKDAHGLHTGQLFTSDLIRDPEPVKSSSQLKIINGGHVTFNEIDHTKLKQIL